MSCVHLQHVCFHSLKKNILAIYIIFLIYLTLSYPQCSLSSEPCRFSYSAWKIGWIDKPSPWHTVTAPSHPSLDQKYAGCSLGNRVATCKSFESNYSISSLALGCSPPYIPLPQHILTALKAKNNIGKDVI